MKSSGSADTTAAAELIARLPNRPKRSIRVVMFANEEQGLVGAKAYAAAHKHELSNIITGAESDFGAGRIWRIDSKVKPEALPVVEKIAELMRPLGIKYGNNNAGGGPDLIPLRAMGISDFSLRQEGVEQACGDEKPTSLTFLYEPSDCSGINSQGSNFSCSGDMSGVVGAFEGGSACVLIDPDGVNPEI